MKLALHDFNTGERVPMTVPDEPIEAFVRYIVETRSWRDYPERIVDKVLRLRKDLLAEARPVVVDMAVAEPEPETTLTVTDGPELVIDMAAAAPKAAPKGKRK